MQVGKPVLSSWVSGTVNVVNSGIDFVEHVDVIFQYSSTQGLFLIVFFCFCFLNNPLKGRRGNVEVVVKSPSGTESILASPHGDAASSYPADGWKFGTVRNWGEVADGMKRFVL